MEYSVDRKSGEAFVTLETLLGEMQIKTGAPESAKVSFTATTDMQSSMGKVVSILNEEMVLVDTVWNNKRQIVETLPIGKLSLGDMIWVHEHLCLEGYMNLLSSKKKSDFGDINFINLTWDSNRARVDVLTGEVDKNGNNS